MHSFDQLAGQLSNVYLTITLCLVLGTDSAFKELIDLDKILKLIPVHVYFNFSNIILDISFLGEYLFVELIARYPSCLLILEF